MPTLPPKTFVMRRFDIEFLVDRRRRLQFYLQSVLKIPNIAVNPDLRAFLAIEIGGTKPPEWC